MSFFNSERFQPLFRTQFLGAFNDNMLKNALVMLLTFRIATQTGGNVQTLVTIAGTMLVVPQIFVSSLAGQIADKFDKARLARVIKLVEIGIMAIAGAGFLAQSIPLLFLALFGMGLHSAFFGPVKLAILPQLLREDELLPGNGYIEAGTFLAILLGTLAGGVLVLLPFGGAVVSLALLAVALAGYWFARGIPKAEAPCPGLRLNWNIGAETINIVNYARSDRDVFLCILGAAWFWFFGATILGQIAPFVRSVLQADAPVVTLLLAVFSIGIGTGSLLCNRLLRGQLQMTYVPLAALGISLFGIDLYFATRNIGAPLSQLTGVLAFMGTLQCWRVIFDFFMMAVAGGLYIVPLYAQIQHNGAPAHMARLIAAGNVLSGLFMVGSALVSLGIFALGFNIPQLYLIVSLANLGVALYICNLLPEALLRGILRSALTLLFRVEVKGLENYSKAGKRVLIIANHISLLDAVLIAAFLPEKLHFVISATFARHWWMQPVLKLVHAMPIDPTKPLATKSLIELLKKDQKCMIFPEGRLTVTGALMKIYEGPGLVADKAGAAVLPIRIDGAQYSHVSRMAGKLRLRWLPRITLTIMPAHNFNIPEDIKGRARRQAASAQLYDIMSDMMFESGNYEQTLFAALLHARSLHGAKHPIAEDTERKPLNYGQFVLRCFTLGRVLARRYPGQPTLGIMLPNASVTAISFFALQAFGKTPSMLNFSAGARQMLAACRMAKVETVLTSRRFVEAAKLDAVVAALSEGGLAVQYLEDIGKTVGLLDKLFGLAAAQAPEFAYRFTAQTKNPDAPAVILYTSGSEGTPKGVALSHRNLLANCGQIGARIDFGPSDKVLNVLPMFHCFGLTGGTLLPILAGIKTFYYPSPLHYRIVPELIYDTNATVMFGTDTFLAGYAKFANPYDMNSIRHMVAGGEKLKEETRQIYAEKFGLRVLEGYGATETAPVISVNTPMQNRLGSVGRLLPNIAHRLEAVPGIEGGGRLILKGPNVMLGYLKAEAPGEIQPLEDGWYDTGDIVEIDAQGYVFIKGRIKRFAKIGGEMVSLAAVEAATARLWPAAQHAAVTIPDDKKGEQIVLVTEQQDAARDALVRHFRQETLPELAVPKRILHVDALPLLGTGKIDHQTARALALAAAAPAALETAAQ